MNKSNIAKKVEKVNMSEYVSENLEARVLQLEKDVEEIQKVLLLQHESIQDLNEAVLSQQRTFSNVVGLMIDDLKFMIERQK